MRMVYMLDCDPICYQNRQTLFICIACEWRLTDASINFSRLSHLNNLLVTTSKFWEKRTTQLPSGPLLVSHTWNLIYKGIQIQF